MTRYIAIEGKGGSGKTYLAHLLQKKLNCELFHLDDYGNDYEPFVGIPRLIEELKNTDAPLVIFEGVGVFDDRFNEYEPFRILVSVPDEIRKMRAEGRDVPTDSRSAAEWSKIYDIWMRAEAEYFTDDLEAKADLVVGEAFSIDGIAAAIRKI